MTRNPVSKSVGLASVKVDVRSSGDLSRLARNQAPITFYNFEPTMKLYARSKRIVAQHHAEFYYIGSHHRVWTT